jgi:hypothetical protein
MYVGKTKPWLANLSRSRKKRIEKGADDEETTAPPPTVPYEPAKERKKQKKQVFKTSGTTKGKRSL